MPVELAHEQVRRPLLASSHASQKGFSIRMHPPRLIGPVGGTRTEASCAATCSRYRRTLESLRPSIHVSVPVYVSPIPFGALLPSPHLTPPHHTPTRLHALVPRFSVNLSLPADFSSSLASRLLSLRFHSVATPTTTRLAALLSDAAFASRAQRFLISTDDRALFALEPEARAAPAFGRRQTEVDVDADAEEVILRASAKRNGRGARLGP
ncbi:unnamed protein product, partial [Protopolystoma xenopodis]